jgi:hypothetical protein
MQPNSSAANSHPANSEAVLNPLGCQLAVMLAQIRSAPFRLQHEEPLPASK